MTENPPILTEQELERIEKREKAASEGPWVCWGGGGYVSIGISEPCQIAEKKPGANYGEGLNQAGRDYIFMAQARTDIPALLASHREQGALIKELAEELRACVSILGIAVEANVPGAHTIRERARAALSKVPR
jgi:hypothetical protein